MARDYGDSPLLAALAVFASVVAGPYSGVHLISGKRLMESRNFALDLSSRIYFSCQI